MKQFLVGYSAMNIDPPLGIGMHGYFLPRYASGILDSLQISALALQLEGGCPVVVLSADLCEIETKFCTPIRQAVAEHCHVPLSHIFLSCTHTHTGPCLYPNGTFPVEEGPVARYLAFVTERLQQAAALAIADLRPGKMGFATVAAPDRIAYIRLYKMKDGSSMTCPPVNDPQIDHSIGTLDQRVHVVRFDREGAQSLVLVNYGIHADTTNGDRISADFVGWLRTTLEKALDGVKCIFLNGAEGDVGSTNIHPTLGDMNDTEISFDNEMKSPGMARFVGRALAGAVLQVYDKVEYVPVDCLQVLEHTVPVAANVPKPEELSLAHEYVRLHEAGRDDLIPYQAMELTTVVAEAVRMCNLEHGPNHFDLTLTGLRLGDVALVGIPGEPFSDIGRRIKQAPGWRTIMPCSLTNGYEEYFPTEEAFAAGGYEARSSRFTPGVADSLVHGAHSLLSALRSGKIS